MKKSTFFLMLLILVTSCKQSNQTKTPTEEFKTSEQEINVIESETSSPDIPVKNIDEVQNIKSQIDDYLTAFLNGNAEKAITYCYPDLFEFMKSQYPQEYSIEEVKSVFKESIAALNEMSVNGVEYEFEVGDINKIAENDDLKLYSIVTYLTVKKGLDSNTSGGEQFAVSNDNGKTWKFLEKDANKNYLKILRMNIPNEIVNRIED